MKKLLLGTTALATAGAFLAVASDAVAQEHGDKLKLSLSGYHQQWAVFNGATELEAVNGDKPFDASFIDEKHNSEVCFVGEVKLDTGITVGVNVQLEANTSGDQIDESYLYIGTDTLGRLIMGDENNAAYLMQVFAPDGGVNLNEGDVLLGPPQQGLFILPGDFGADTSIATTKFRFADNDSGKFTYISPRWAGFQLGASYIPNFETNGGDNNNSISRIDDAGGPGGTNGMRDGYAVAVNFSEVFDGFGIQASGGYMYGDVAPAVGSNDFSAIGGGLQLSFGGFTFGGSYITADGDRTGGATPTTYNGDGYDVGASYAFGPYKVGLTYQRGENDGRTDLGSKQHLDAIVLSGTYRVGPGVNWVGGVYAVDADGEDNFVAGNAAATTVGKSNGIGAATGLKLSF
jgi:predicted porin